MPKAKPQTVESPFTVEMDSDEKEKLSNLQAFCIANKIPSVSKGVVIRALLRTAQETPDLLGIVREQVEIEAAELSEKRGRR